MQNLLKSKIVIGIAVVVVLIIILVATEVLKFEASIKRTPSAEEEQAPSTASEEKKKEAAQEPKLASRAIEFTGAKGKVTFSINLPVGWAQGQDARVDFVAGSPLSETLSNGQKFTVNINAIADKHGPAVKSFADYVASWKNETLAQSPSMEFVADGTKTVNGMDVYILEMKNTRPDSMVIHQIQYLFYVDDTYAMVATGSVPDETWAKYQGVISESLESIKKAASESATQTQ